ncbi:hypothetical protein HNY73_004393 [Argiope bruennichi]|uniref:Uncharacterized protein n=1 Tax=Argiope bruennichi TaxID=94029 RepID=A0A8T0FNU2_ARGBR|nr:hypothetical protein HNY73_004393 [Argiope bruennichi]
MDTAVNRDLFLEKLNVLIAAHGLAYEKDCQDNNDEGIIPKALSLSQRTKIRPLNESRGWGRMEAEY